MTRQEYLNLFMELLKERQKAHEEFMKARDFSEESQYIQHKEAYTFVLDKMYSCFDLHPSHAIQYVKSELNYNLHFYNRYNTEFVQKLLEIKTKLEQYSDRKE